MLLKNIFKITLAVVIIFSYQLVSAQGKKQVKQLLEAGNEQYRLAEEGDWQGYIRALQLYLAADSIKPNDPEVSYSVGACYSHTDHKLAALPYLETAKKGGIKYPDLDYYLGCSYHLADRFDEAIALFQVYKKSATKEQLPEINRLIAYCQNGIELIKKPIDVKITNLGPEVNSKYPDYHPSISADENTLLFISRRENTTGAQVDILDNHYYEDIYISEKVAKKWTPAETMGFGINTESHDGCVGLSPDGQELFVYRWSQEGNGDLYSSDLVGAEWSAPRHLGANINSKAWESDVSVTPDKKVIFFTSTKKGGFGGRDIYMARRLPNGEYAVPINLGPKINTELDEDAPFIHPDGKTLYFSSQGHKSMGGYDIFSCTINIEKAAILTDPINVGFPINTADDDVFFVWSPDNKRAYFASERKGGYGEKDIYLLERTDIEAALVVLKGIVRSSKDSIPLGAKITVIDNATQQSMGVYESNNSSGKYIVILPEGKNYGIRVESPGYLFYSKNIHIPVLEQYHEIEDEVYLDQMEVGTKITLRNVFFDVDKATLRPESEAELAKLVEVLKNNKSMKIQISGHTDSDGNEDHNLKLSEERAHAVVDYLVAKGIDAYRLTFKGFGETKPVVANDTPENKQMNRRTEIEITEFK